MQATTKALVYIERDPETGTDQVADLMRLALLFDEIHCILPRFEVAGAATGMHLDFSKEGPHKVAENLGVWSRAKVLGDELTHTLSVLVQEGIAKYIDLVSHMDLEGPILVDTFRKVQIIDHDFGADSKEVDEVFVPISRMIDLNVTGKHANPLQVGDFPGSLAAAVTIVIILHFAHATSSSPVFLNPLHRREVAHRYKQFQDGLRVLEEHAPGAVAPVDFKAIVGEVAFSVANSIASSQLLARKTVEDVVRYRAVMEDARRRFLSEGLMEATALVQDNPWSEQTKQELEKYIRGKLSQDIARYDSESREVWEKLFGTLAVRLTEVTKAAVIGGAAGTTGLLANVIPGASAWTMLLAGGLLGATKEAPGAVQAIVDALLEERKRRRSGIAYLARFR